MAGQKLIALAVAASLTSCSFWMDKLPQRWKPPAKPRCQISDAPTGDALGAVVFGVLSIPLLESPSCGSENGLPCNLPVVGGVMLITAALQVIGAVIGAQENSRCRDARKTYATWETGQVRAKAVVPIAPGLGLLGRGCFPNATCRAGLECVAGQCQAAPLAGREHGVCFGNGTCFEGLVCAADGHCVPGPAEGTLGGTCYGNSTCDPPLTCVAGACMANP